ncbi:MAG: pantetheine-phosphate adenylyltransferase [Bacteriovoracaceae bacterium]|nr:pantetheine-phosphate adenylyltransferase [Bacteriovoracaceae bacterium]
MKKNAIYPGSFDPLTNGHINLVERALSIFDTITISVAINTKKPNVFSLEERVSMIERVFKSNDHVKVDSFEGLLVDYVAKRKTAVVIRGIRTNTDFEYELGIAQANRHLSPEFETIFMMTDPQFSFLSSSMIKEIVSLGGSTNGMLPAFIEEALKKRLKEKK